MIDSIIEQDQPSALPRRTPNAHSARNRGLYEGVIKGFGETGYTIRPPNSRNGRCAQTFAPLWWSCRQECSRPTREHRSAVPPSIHRGGNYEHYFSQRPVQVRRRRRGRHGHVHARGLRTPAAGSHHRGGRRSSRGRNPGILREARAHHRHRRHPRLRCRGHRRRRRGRARRHLGPRGRREGGAASEGGHGSVPGQHLRLHHRRPDGSRRRGGRRISHQCRLLPPLRSRAGAPVGLQLRRGFEVAVEHRRAGRRADG